MCTGNINEACKLKRVERKVCVCVCVFYITAHKGTGAHTVTIRDGVLFSKMVQGRGFFFTD
jgi:hypothetical protein